MTKSNTDEIASTYSDIIIINKKIEEISESGSRAIIDEKENLESLYSLIIKKTDKIIETIKVEELIKNEKYDYLDILEIKSYMTDCYFKLNNNEMGEYIKSFNQRKRYNKKLNSLVLNYKKKE